MHLFRLFVKVFLVIFFISLYIFVYFFPPSFFHFRKKKQNKTGSVKTKRVMLLHCTLQTKRLFFMQSSRPVLPFPGNVGAIYTVFHNADVSPNNTTFAFNKYSEFSLPTNWILVHVENICVKQRRTKVKSVWAPFDRNIYQRKVPQIDRHRISFGKLLGIGHSNALTTVDIRFWSVLIYFENLVETEKFGIKNYINNLHG
jgi:hypothetical protein